MPATTLRPSARRLVPALAIALAFALANALLATPLAAQAQTARVDSLFSSITADAPGCAVAAAQGGRILVNRSYGLADLESRSAITPETKFDIGSTHKQFVAAAVLLLVADGRLALSDDVRRFLPELPDYGHRITVNHLLTHTSGIRDWPPLQAMAGDDAEVLALIFRQRGLNFTPGDEFSYSNSGYVLLKEIVARVSGQSFAEFTRRRIFEPLGMQHSEYVADVLQGSGAVARAYERRGERWESFMRLGTRRGGGTVISTPGDLLIWNAALRDHRLGERVTAGLLERAQLNNGRRLTYARGLMINDVPGGPVISHSGGAAGFGSWLGRFTAHDLSVAVLCNFESVSASNLASRVADLYLPPVGPQSRPGGPRPMPGVDVGTRAGLYFDTKTGDPMRLGVEAGRLAVANGPPLMAVSAERMVPPRASIFFRSEATVEFVFRGSDEFAIVSTEGDTALYRRAQPHTASAEALQQLSGRYAAPDVGQVFELTPIENGVQLRSERNPERTLRLQAVAPDTFMASLVILRVQRDAQGRVTGLEYANPAIRRMRFDRL